MTIRPAAVAGRFYEGNPARLTASVDGWLSEAKQHVKPLPAPPKALILPHAGHIYSGPTAACGYVTIPQSVREIILFGPAHQVYTPALALPDATDFASPLGNSALNTDNMARASQLPQVTQHDAAHQWEHSLEVHLPFLQRWLTGGFRLTPFVVGGATAAQVAEVMNLLWGGEETLILVSSDLSHFLNYEEARAADQTTIGQILAGQEVNNHEQACGATVINGLLHNIRHHHPLTPHLLDYRNSGDTAGDRRRVVGYGTIAFVAQ